MGGLRVIGNKRFESIPVDEMETLNSRCSAKSPNITRLMEIYENRYVSDFVPANLINFAIVRDGCLQGPDSGPARYRNKAVYGNMGSAGRRGFDPIIERRSHNCALVPCKLQTLRSRCPR